MKTAALRAAVFSFTPMTFQELGLHDQILEAISYMGFKEATPVQEQAIPLILQKKDLIACAQTGTGKTAAFMLPILQALTETPHAGKTRALVIVPTRELALQIDQQIQGFSYFLDVHSFALYGGGDGDDWVQQKKALQSGADIIVATPGKLLSHLTLGGYADFSRVEYLILDEADRMLDIGFHDDIMKIISYLPKERQSLMFSATMPPKIRKFAKEILHQPAEITFALSKPAEGVEQGVFPVYGNQKIALLRKLLGGKNNPYQTVLVFTSTKRMVSEIVRNLKGRGYAVEGISSNLRQSEREEVLNRFRARKTRVLVATDVLSRGIDIKDIHLVINFDVPQDAEDYVHRVGRTARAETTGRAITFVTPEEAYKLRRIEQLIERQIPRLKLPEELGEGPNIDSSNRRRKENQRNKRRNRFQKHGKARSKGGNKRGAGRKKSPRTPRDKK